jgi:DNA-binding transcriptional MerR regulator
MKQPKSPRTNYRIAEFAEYMGVTPNFLKHYEECGLLDVHHRENGYRYFNFDQCSRILEYMRLRNYGVTVMEMRSMLMADADEALLLLDEKVKELRKQADRISAVLDEHKRVHA